jgi:hypothetical protein
MGGDGWAVLGIMVPLFLGQSGALVAALVNGRGYKISYLREKERSDRQEQITRDAAQATDIAVKTAKALHEIIKGGVS